MIYFCADDYGISKISNSRIEKCLEGGTLNKISVLPNGEITDFKSRLLDKNVKLSLHINLVEGFPLSKREDVSLLVNEDGAFKHSFVGLFFLSFFKRKELEKQLYSELKNQIDFWREHVGKDTPLLIDSHQHTHMIPSVFKTLIRVIKQEKVEVEYIRIPAEPIAPYIKTPSLYFSIGPVGIIKQWLLKFLNLVNKRELKKANLKTCPFLGILFSGSVTKDKINKLLPHYKKINENVEVTLHPGYLEEGEPLIDGCKKSFKNFYYSKWRKMEYNTLINFK